MKFLPGPPLASLALLSGLLVLSVACKKDSDTGLSASAALPDVVKFVQPGLYPEGTQYDSQSGRFLVSSQTAGRIGQVTGDIAATDTTNTGIYTIFADNDQLISTIGLNLDASRNRLLAAVSDPGYNQGRTTPATEGKLAALAIFNRSTGTLGQFINLSGLPLADATKPHFANDIAIDAQGNAYVTDSYAPIIYKVSFDAKGNGTASVWLSDPALSAPAGMFGLNGIVYHPSGYLLVAKSNEGKLLKIRIVNNQPGTLTTVALPTGLSLQGDDGLQLFDNTTLHVVCNAQGKVYRLKTTTDFDSVKTSYSTFDANVAGVSPYPTTLTQRTISGPGTTTAATASYVLYAHLDSLQASKKPAVKRFALKQVFFK
jgi:sugar lactone lactonase YvrE